MRLIKWLFKAVLWHSTHSRDPRRSQRLLAFHILLSFAQHKRTVVWGRLLPVCSTSLRETVIIYAVPFIHCAIVLTLRTVGQHLGGLFPSQSINANMEGAEIEGYLSIQSNPTFSVLASSLDEGDSDLCGPER